MTNTDSPLDEIIDKLIEQHVEIPVHFPSMTTDSYKEEDRIKAEAKKELELYCHKQVIEELEKIIGNAHTDKGINWWIDLEDVHKRIVELRKTL